MVQWDLVAVIVALVAIPLMISPNALQALRSCFVLVYRNLYPVTAQCERLQWSDVPDGYIFNCPNDCSGSSDLRQDADCLQSTLGSFFQRAWVSPSRRNRTVPKPKQLSLDTHYVRSDTKLLKAYLLMNPILHDNIRFHDLGGVLTAHLVIKHRRWVPSPGPDLLYERHIPHRCTLTKREIELILEGYPPDYSEQILIQQEQQATSSAQSISVPSPIRERADIHRGGWIIGAALNCYNKDLSRTAAILSDYEFAQIGHVMEPTERPNQNHPNRWARSNDFLPRQRAVLRVRHVFLEILKVMPDQETTIKAALEFINIFFSGSYDVEAGDVDAYRLPNNRMPIPRHFPPSMFQRIVQEANLYRLSTPETDYHSRGFAARLSGPEWARAMGIFNNFESLSSEDAEFLRPRLIHVVQAAATGVWDVLGDRYEEKFPELPDLPELRERRYIYIYDCKQGQTHGEEEEG